MRRFAILLALVCATRVARADDAADLLGRVLSSLKAGTDCGKTSPTRPWCMAAGGWATANMAPLPKAKLLVGVTVTLVDQGVIVTELRDHTELSALALSGDAAHPKIAMHGIAYDSATTSAKAIGAVTMVLKGKAKIAALPGGVDTARGALAQTTAEDLVHAASGQGWSWSGGELRKIGSTWVAIQPIAGGVDFTILTDKAQ